MVFLFTSKCCWRNREDSVKILEMNISYDGFTLDWFYLHIYTCRTGHTAPDIFKSRGPRMLTIGHFYFFSRHFLRRLSILGPHHPFFPVSQKPFFF